MKVIKGAVLGVVVGMSTSLSLYADFTYTETTQITGGSMMGMMKMAGAFSRQARQMGQPVVSTVAIKGNRMARINPDRTEIIDLDAETITTIDTVKREYTVVTFEQMKQQMEAAAEKARAQQQKSAQTAPAEQPANTDVKFEVHVRNTGQSRDVVGLNASEAILTMNMNATDKTSGQTGSMAITNDMWMAPEIPGYDEVKEFYRKYALKMGTVFSSAVSPAMLAQYRDAGAGMADMAKEMSKLKGTPVLQVMRMGMTTDGSRCRLHRRLRCLRIIRRRCLVGMWRRSRCRPRLLVSWVVLVGSGTRRRLILLPLIRVRGRLLVRLLLRVF